MALVTVLTQSTKAATLPTFQKDAPLLFVLVVKTEEEVVEIDAVVAVAVEAVIAVGAGTLTVTGLFNGISLIFLFDIKVLEFQEVFGTTSKAYLVHQKHVLENIWGILGRKSIAIKALVPG